MTKTAHWLFVLQFSVKCWNLMVVPGASGKSAFLKSSDASSWNVNQVLSGMPGSEDDQHPFSPADTGTNDYQDDKNGEEGSFESSSDQRTNSSPPVPNEAIVEGGNNIAASPSAPADATGQGPTAKNASTPTEVSVFQPDRTETSFDGFKMPTNSTGTKSEGIEALSNITTSFSDEPGMLTPCQLLSSSIMATMTIGAIMAVIVTILLAILITKHARFRGFLNERAECGRRRFLPNRSSHSNLRGSDGEQQPAGQEDLPIGALLNPEAPPVEHHKRAVGLALDDDWIVIDRGEPDDSDQIDNDSDTVDDNSWVRVSRILSEDDTSPD